MKELRAIIGALALALAGCSNIGDPDARLAICGASAQQEADAIDAMDAWNHGVGSGLSPATCEERGSSDGTITFTTDAYIAKVCPHGDNPDNQGCTTVSEGRIVLRASTLASDSVGADRWTTYDAMLHELGHWLTGLEHSDHIEDVMFPSIDPTIRSELTARDRGRFSR